MNSDAGRGSLGWLLGDGEARGIALVFLVAWIVMVLAAIGAFFTKSHHRISAQYLDQGESVLLRRPIEPKPPFGTFGSDRARLWGRQ